MFAPPRGRRLRPGSSSPGPCSAESCRSPSSQALLPLTREAPAPPHPSARGDQEDHACRSVRAREGTRSPSCRVGGTGRGDRPRAPSNEERVAGEAQRSSPSGLADLPTGRCSVPRDRPAHRTEMDKPGLLRAVECRRRPRTDEAASAELARGERHPLSSGRRSRSAVRSGPGQEAPARLGQSVREGVDDAERPG